jgi:hypothetical protein
LLDVDRSRTPAPLVFDAPDGEPGVTSDPPQFFTRDCEHWADQCFGVLDGETTKVITDSEQTSVDDEEALCEVVGLFFVQIIKELRDAGAFSHLPVAPKCHLGVSTYDGVFGWPIYEERGKEDLL